MHISRGSLCVYRVTFNYLQVQVGDLGGEKPVENYITVAFAQNNIRRDHFDQFSCFFFFFLFIIHLQTL